jgi:hypothetical protein
VAGRNEEGVGGTVPESKHPPQSRDHLGLCLLPHRNLAVFEKEQADPNHRILYAPTFGGHDHPLLYEVYAVVWTKAEVLDTLHGSLLLLNWTSPLCIDTNPAGLDKFGARYSLNCCCCCVDNRFCCGTNEKWLRANQNIKGRFLSGLYLFFFADGRQ